MATIYDVCNLAGVSLATVSRVMNGNAKVADKTRHKVIDAMNQLGYRPNAIAQSLASSRSNSVGVLVSELYGAFYGAMMSGIETELRNAGKHVFITTGHSDEKREKESIEFLISRKCDALVLHGEQVSDDYLIQLAKGPTPLVLINRYIPELADQCISLNNEQGGYLAARALIENGHTQIAYISGPLWKTDALERLKGHKRALDEANLTFDEKLLFEGDFQQTGGIEGFNHLTGQHRQFTAVACGNDEIASGAMKAARALDLEIPDDISFVGFDNVIVASYVYPRLSSINYPVHEMGHMAAIWIRKNVYHESQLEVQNVFEPEFIARDSIKQLS